MTVTVKHTRQHGTLVYGTYKGDGTGALLYAGGFRLSENLPADEQTGETPEWYMPHSRRRTAPWKVEQTVAALRDAGHDVAVEIDDTTPAIGFSDLEAERNDRAADRTERYAGRAVDRASESETIRAANKRTADQLNGTPILVGHYSEGAHRRLMERLWNRESKAWGLYEQAKVWRDKAAASARYRHRREAVGTTLRRIKKLEKRLRDIAAAVEGEVKVLWDNPGDWPGPLDEQLQAYRDKGVPVTVLGATDNGDGTRSVRVHVGVTDHRRAVYAAEVFEITDELTYWQQVIADSGVKVWTRDDFVKGDFVSVGRDIWCEVARVNAGSVSVPGRFDPDAGQIRTVAGQRDRHRGATANTTVPYDEITGKMTAEEARERFPAAFAEPLDGPAPKRPARKRGKVKLTHRPAAQGENWYYTIGDTKYRAYWPHPEGWFSLNAAGDALTGEIPPVRVYEAVVFIGKPDIDTGQRIEVPGPLRFVEQVHNLVRAFVEEAARAAAPEPAGT